MCVCARIMPCDGLASIHGVFLPWIPEIYHNPDQNKSLPKNEWIHVCNWIAGFFKHILHIDKWCALVKFYICYVFQQQKCPFLRGHSFNFQVKKMLVWRLLWSFVQDKQSSIFCSYWTNKGNMIHFTHKDWLWVRYSFNTSILASFQKFVTEWKSLNH